MASITLFGIETEKYTLDPSDVFRGPDALTGRILTDRYRRLLPEVSGAADKTNAVLALMRDEYEEITGIEEDPPLDEAGPEVDH